MTFHFRVLTLKCRWIVTLYVMHFISFTWIHYKCSVATKTEQSRRTSLSLSQQSTGTFPAGYSCIRMRLEVLRL